MVLLFYVLLPIPILGRMMIPPVPYSNYNQLEKSKINVDVFYESLCPDSKNFFLNTLSPTLSQFSPYISVTLVPYGKAKLTRREPTYQFSCQHGSDECQGNLYHNCAQKYITDQGAKIRFISCMFENVLPSRSSKPDWLAISRHCTEQLGLAGELGSLYNCAVDLEGRQLHYKAGLRTGSREFIPTVEMSGGREMGKVVLDTRMKVKNLVKEICDLYKILYGVSLQPCL